MLARQPILDKHRKVFGYELLFRPGEQEDGGNASPELQSARVINEVMHLYGLKNLLNNRCCFVNFSRQSMLDQIYTVLPPDLTVIEIMESVEVDDLLIRACRQARSLGYSLALDHFVPDQGFEPLLPFVDLLKVDFPEMSDSQQSAIVKTSRQFGLDLVAERVECPQQFRQAKELGYQYFQGYFFCRPELVRAKRLSVNFARQMRLVTLAGQQEFCVEEIENVIRQDVALSYKLLRYLNSPVFPLRQKIESIRHAVTLIGPRHLRQWVLLLSVCDLGNQKPSELMNICLTRARFCESMAEKYPAVGMQEKCFVVGLLSVLDAMLDQPMEQILSDLALSDSIRDTLLQKQTPFRILLDLAIACEQGNWAEISRVAEACFLDEQDLVDAYLRAVAWAGDTLRATAAADSP